MPLDIDSLTEYLNDHLGGAAGATDLLRRRLDEGRGNDELAELLAGIETHRTLPQRRPPDRRLGRRAHGPAQAQGRGAARRRRP